MLAATEPGVHCGRMPPRSCEVPYFIQVFDTKQKRNVTEGCRHVGLVCYLVSVQLGWCLPIIALTPGLA